MRLINEIRRADPPYKCVCVEFGNIMSKYQLRAGFLLSHKKSKLLITYRWKNIATKGWSVTIKNFSIALSKREA